MNDTKCPSLCKTMTAAFPPKAHKSVLMRHAAWLTALGLLPMGLLAQSIDTDGAYIPSVLQVDSDPSDVAAEEALLGRLATMQPDPHDSALESESTRSTYAVLLQRLTAASKVQDMQGRGLAFELDGLNSQSEVEYDWPIKTRLYPYLASLAHGNKIHIHLTSRGVVVCDTTRFEALGAMGFAKQFRQQILTGGGWRVVPRELADALKGTMDVLKDRPSIVWDVNGEHSLVIGTYTCTIARENEREILVTQPLAPEGKGTLTFLFPVKQARLAAAGSFQDVETFLRFTDSEE